MIFLPEKYVTKNEIIVDTTTQTLATVLSTSLAKFTLKINYSSFNYIIL